MVSRSEKRRMMEFVAERIEASRRYDIQDTQVDRIVISQKKELIENPGKVHIFLHSAKMPLPEYNHQVWNIINKGGFVGNILYKDDSNFMVRLAARANFKRNDRSLKDYTQEDINKMIHLRGLEKAVLELQNGSTQLAYFQPGTQRLQESIRVYDMLPVNLDYSHIGIGDRGYDFVENRESIDYKIAEEKFSLSDKGLFLSRRSSTSPICLVHNPE